MARLAAECDDNEYDDVAHSAQEQEAEAAMEEPIEFETFVYFNPDRAIEHSQYDIGIELGTSVARPTVEVNEKLIADGKYRERMRCLNAKQGQFF